LDQAVGTLAQTEAAIPQLEIDLRQANDQLCILLGTPSVDLRESIPVWRSVDQRKAEETERVRKLLQQLLTQKGPQKPEDLQRLETIVSPIYIPNAPGPKEVAIGIPADLLRRRPDVRRAERLAAAQAELIGWSEADLYPAFAINGSLGYSAENFPDLFRSTAFNGSIGPRFDWNILNYGRLVNQVRRQDARFQELVFAYQETVLAANGEVEDGLVNFLRSDQRRELFGRGVMALIDAVRYVTRQQAEGQIDINRYAVIAQNLVQQETSWARAYGDIAQGLIAVYRALGGGWEIRLGEEAPGPPMAGTLPGTPKDAEEVPAPIPNARGEIAEPLAVPQPVPDRPRAEAPAAPNGKP
jgi:outer membrane protein TolC